MILPNSHKTLEESAFRALPALQTEAYDGWIVRLSGGGPKRANSVNVLEASTLPLAQKIERCERLFAEKGVVPAFRMTAHKVDAGLDALLDARGYLRQDESIVMARQLADLDTSAAACTILSADKWLDQLPQIDQGTPERKRKHVELLRRLSQQALHYAIDAGGRYVAMGLAVIDGNQVGLFDIATLPDARRRGHARALTLALMRDAKMLRAESAYLQVVAQNQAAVSLYKSLGFAECYRYWYRVAGVTE